MQIGFITSKKALVPAGIIGNSFLIRVVGILSIISLIERENVQSMYESLELLLLLFFSVA